MCHPLFVSWAHADDISGVSSVSALGNTGASDTEHYAVFAHPDSSKQSEQRKQQEQEAADKRAQADELFKQADDLGSSLAQAQADLNNATTELEAACAQRDETQQRLSDESEKLNAVETKLETFVTEMYKQGGVAPYLDVLLRSTSYTDFIHSWNALATVYEKGEELAAERHEIKQKIEDELSQCEEKIKQIEKDKAVADAKQKQLYASQLALRAQACDINVEATELLGDENEINQAKEAAEEAHRLLDEAIAQGLASANINSGNGVLANPCPEGNVSSGFGYREFDHSDHQGLDLSAPEGTPYYAAESGTVVAATNGGDDNGGAGNWIVIDHGNGLVTKYMHSLVVFVKEGDTVERGQNIGLVGNTGNSTGAHLHFQVEENGTPLDPMSFLSDQSSSD